MENRLNLSALDKVAGLRDNNPEQIAVGILDEQVVLRGLEVSARGSYIGANRTRACGCCRYGWNVGRKSERQRQ